jgi:hypothetical protein
VNSPAVVVCIEAFATLPGKKGFSEVNGWWFNRDRMGVFIIKLKRKK